MTREQNMIFEKMFRDFEAIKQFQLRRMTWAQEAPAFDDIYSIIDALYCEYSTEHKTESVTHRVSVKIKERYNNSLHLWAPTRYLEMLELWYDYILFNYE
jgi:hypothetical protein